MPKDMPPQPGGPYKCGQCKWFRHTIRGKNCQESREVLLDTPACVEFQADKKRPYEELERDRFIRDMESQIEVYTTDYLSTVSKEVKQYHLFDHKKRDARSYMSDREMFELANRFETCQAYTDRVIELKDELRDQKLTILKLLKDSQGYLFSHYTDVMRTLKNDPERGMFQRAVLPKISNALDRLDGVLDKLDLIHANLKDTHFSMRETLSAAKTIWDAKGQSMVSGKVGRADD